MANIDNSKINEHINLIINEDDQVHIDNDLNKLKDEPIGEFTHSQLNVID
jgi:hypothetical protein